MMADTSSISLSIWDGDIAVLTLHPIREVPTGTAAEFVDQFERHLDKLVDRVGLTGVILCSGQPDVFFVEPNSNAAAGDEAKRERWATAQRARGLLQRFAKLPCVSVAAIRGACLGAGAELAMWCDRRLIADDRTTRIGFPEVTTANFPGWGGTVRAPRLVGLAKAVDMICDGELLDPETAQAVGLVEEVVPAERLPEAAVALVRSEALRAAYRSDRARWNRPVAVDEPGLALLQGTATGNWLDQSHDLRPVAVRAARTTMLASARLDLPEACEQEGRDMAALFGLPIDGTVAEAKTPPAPEPVARTPVNRVAAESTAVAADGGPGRGGASAIEIESYVRDRLAALLEVEADEIDVDSDLFDLGLDSVLLVQMRRDLEALLGRRLPAEKLRDFDTLRDVTDYLVAELTSPGS